MYKPVRNDEQDIERANPASGSAEVFALHKIDDPVLHKPGARNKEQGRRSIDGVGLPAPAVSGPAEVLALHNIDTTVPEMEKKARVLISIEERKVGERLIIQALQNLEFEKEIVTLLKLNVCKPNSYRELKSKKSRLIALSPFLDENGLLRAGGRLGRAKSIPYESRHPLILPNSENEFVASLIRYIHERNCHCTSLETFYLLRRLYYVIGGKESVSRVVKKCVACQKVAKLPKQQKMGDLPPERIEVAAPFMTSGVDVFGDFPVTHAGRGHRKRWVLLVTCFVTRAVCLLPLPDMTLSSVVNALTRMNGQFPSVTKLVSDQGSNFKGASREIREAIEAWDKTTLTDRIGEMGITWEFGPAASGHWGGVWERLVGLIKNSMKACLNGKVVNVDTFDTLCAAVAGVVNRRPLTAANNDVNSVQVLSPAHFIYPYTFVNSGPHLLPPLSQLGDHLRSSWQETRTLLDDFWCRWRTEYLETLLHRSKWQTSSENYAVGDVVIICEAIVPRERWRVARIMEITSQDATHHRRFKLRDSAGNVFDRDQSGVVKLEL